jgi:hypothetical protein
VLQDLTLDPVENERTQQLADVSTPKVSTPSTSTRTSSLLHRQHYRAPSVSSSADQSSRGAGPAGARKGSGKRTRIESSLDASVSENTKLLELAKGSYEFRAATIAAKRHKMELKAEQEREGQRYAAEERNLAIKERMQEKEFEHRERMIKYELELARLKTQATQVPPPSQAMLSGTIFSSESSLTGSFGHTNTQTDLFPTAQGSASFESFSFPTQPTPAGQSAKVWPSIP